MWLPVASVLVAVAASVALLALLVAPLLALALFLVLLALAEAGQVVAKVAVDAARHTHTTYANQLSVHI